MNLQFLNLGFSLLSTAVSAAVLALAIWFGLRIWTRLAKTKPAERTETRVRLGAWSTWVLVAGFMTLSALNSSGPRITVSDHFGQSDQSSEAQVRNIAPTPVSDQERLKTNQDLHGETAIPRQ